MAARIPWDQYEIALLFDAYEQIATGENTKAVAAELSKTLRAKAVAEGKQIDATFRNVNGMMMQLGNVQYLVTDGKRGLSGASASIRQAFAMMKDNPEDFKKLREEAKQMVASDNDNTVVCGFIAYLQEQRPYYKQEQVSDLLKKAEQFCLLKSPLLGNTDIKTVQNVQQKVANSGLLRFKYGLEESKRIQDIVSHYYAFIKSYRKSKSIVSTSTQEAENRNGDVPILKNDPNETHSRELSIEAFENWLKNDKKFSERTAYLYALAIKYAQQYISEHHLVLVLLTTSLEVATSTITALLEDPNFCDKGVLYRYRTAFSHYVDFLASEPVESPLDQTNDGNSTQALLMNEIASVITESFPRGIRPNSIIDQKKLQRAYATKYGKDIDDTVDFQKVIQKLGISVGEFVRVFSLESKKQIINLIHEIISNGAGNVFYSELYNKHPDLWESLHVEDSEMLALLLKKLLPEYHYTNNYFYVTGATFETDLLNAYAEDLVLSCDQVHERLPYMDMPTIKLTLSRLHSFVWSEIGVFAKTDRVQLAEEDISYVKNVALPEMQQKGYFGLNQLPLQASCELNPELSFFAVRDAIYWRHMADQADRLRVIATPKGKTVSSYDLIKNWCDEHDQVTNDELTEIEQDITGSFHYLGGYYACQNMVRVDQDTFVHDRVVSFDVTATDNAIALFAQDRLTSLNAITSFTSFPDLPGYAWNLYLVESFLRRFSKRYSIDGGPAQTSYVGCIAPKNQEYSCYEDRLAAAIIQDNVPIDEKSVGEYLITKKYILRRTGSQIKVICGKALKLQEQRSANGV